MQRLKSAALQEVTSRCGALTLYRQRIWTRVVSIVSTWPSDSKAAHFRCLRMSISFWKIPQARSLWSSHLVLYRIRSSLTMRRHRRSLRPRHFGSIIRCKTMVLADLWDPSRSRHRTQSRSNSNVHANLAHLLDSKSIELSLVGDGTYLRIRLDYKSPSTELLLFTSEHTNIAILAKANAKEADSARNG